MPVDATYALTLHFAQIETCGVREAAFDFKVQGEPVAESADVIHETG